MGKEKENRIKADARPVKNSGRYTIWSNYRKAYSWMREMEGPSYFFFHSLYVLLAVVQPFLAMAFPGAVVYLLESGREPGRILLMLAGYVLPLQGMHVAKGYLDGWCRKKQLLLRIRIGEQLFGASMDADYQALEARTGQQKLKDAESNLYFGDYRGIQAYLKVLGDFLISLFGLILYSVVTGRQSLGILALSLGAAGLAAGIHVYAGRRAVKYDEKYEKVWTDYNELGNEVLASAHGKDIRMYHMWSWFSREYESLKEEFVRWGHKWWICCKRNAGLVERGLVFVRDLLVYGYLIRQMMQGSIGLSAFLIYVGVAAGFGGWMTPMLEALNAILENNKYMTDYRAFLDFAGQPGGKACAGRPGGKACAGQPAGEACAGQPHCRPAAQPGKTHEIRLEHVSFRYEGNQEDTIRDMSLVISPGEKVALVGMNGAGKSTLIKLICGLYRPSSGRICLDGRDISEFPSGEYYRKFAVVFQDVFAFSFPLEDNVTCRERAFADGERLKSSLQEAGLWERVQRLEKKEHTYMNRDLDSDGVTLSGGEMQKLMLARALYKDAPVLILDEPTASLDPIAESWLYEKYHGLTRGKTSIFISHRLSSTKFCDRILFMEGGRITEQGGHEELMARQGAYAAMFHTQAQYYNDNAQADRETETKAETKTETKAEAKTETKAERKTEAKTETKAETKTETKTETKAETKTERNTASERRSL